jgi:plasmid stabilization system protein ParE
MTRKVRLSHQAESDLEQLFVYYWTEGGESTAARFFEAFDETRKMLRQYPEMGTTPSWVSDRLQTVRILPVKGPFRNVLVVHQPTEDGPYILRVLHGARDLQTLFSETE